MSKGWRIFLAIPLPLLCGLGLVTWSELGGQARIPALSNHVVLKISEHLGAGAIVAAIVAALFHLREFSEFFSDLAEKTLLNYEYLSRLKTPELLHVRALAIDQIVKKQVTVPEYDYADLCKAVEQHILERALPGDTATGEYRLDFNDTYEVSTITKQELVEAMELPKEAAAVLPDESTFSRRVNTCSYTVVRPKESISTFDVPLAMLLTPLHSSKAFDALKMAVLELRNESGDWERVELSKAVDGETGQVIYKPAKPVHVPYKGGRAAVRFRLVYYQPADIENFLLDTMRLPTKGLNATLLLAGKEKRTVKTSVLGLGTALQPVKLENGVQLTHKGWFLPQQGYIMWW
jgi:hypothetical protein